MTSEGPGPPEHPVTRPRFISPGGPGPGPRVGERPALPRAFKPRPRLLHALRRILASGLFWLGVVALLGAALSYATALQSTEGLADLGYFVLAILAFVVAGGLHGGFLLAAPTGAPRWKLGVATAVAALSLVAVALMLTRGVDAGTVRVAAFIIVFALPALAGLVRSPRLWRA